MNNKTVLVLLIPVVLFMAGCASQKEAALESSPRSPAETALAEAQRTADSQRVRDWKNRGLGEDSSPAWIMPASRGNWKIFKQDWEMRSDKVLKIYQFQAPRLNAALTIAEVQYMGHLARELKTTVLNEAGSALDQASDEYDAVNNAVLKAKVTLAGHERLTDFWQLIETTDPSGKKVSVYNVYVVYAYDPDVWSKIVAKYLSDVVQEIPNRETQRTIAAMFQKIDEETRYPPEKSEAQFRAEIRAQQAALQRPLSEAARREAYRSGDPVKIAAASVTPDDVDYIAALAALAGME
jgi:hypothetical protein